MSRSSANPLSFARTPAANPRADVVVIGGGPGGSTAATMMARQGLSVILLERETFPRDHVGESLLPASIPVLEELGVLPAVQQAGFLPKYGATMVWGRQNEPWSWYFSETNRQYPHSYQVWRPQFDQLLLDNGRVHGVDVREGHQVRAVEFCDDGPSRVHYRAGDGPQRA
ncbi:MAG: tryptophan 7-halogenase [bacterium]|nr:tryptophan 7-halogenase [bacterium]